MKRLTALVASLILPFFQAATQWTTPRLIDPTLTTSQSNPMIAVGPHREMAIAFNEGGRFVCYTSTDLGSSFVRIVVDSGGFRPPWYYFNPSTVCNVGFDRNGNVLLMKKSTWYDDLAVFNAYSIVRLLTDSTRFSSIWYTSFGMWAPMPSPLNKPTMIIEDTALQVLRDDHLFCPYGFVFMSLSGDSLRNKWESNVYCLPPPIQYTTHLSADLMKSQRVVLCAFSAYKGPPTYGYAMFLGRKFGLDTVFASPSCLDTSYSTLPCLVGLDSVNVALLYSAGTGIQYSDTVLVARIFSDTATSFPPPFRVAARPTRPVVSGYTTRAPVLTTLAAHRYFVYRSYDASGSVVAYYQFTDLRSAPTDSAFFSGYDFGSLAVDSLGGKYLVMVGPDNRVYLTAKDVVSGVRNDGQVPTEMVLGQNYPNPFNSTTTISVSIIKQSSVQLKVFNLLGQEVATLVNERMSAGMHDVRFDASKLSSGVYFYLLHAGDFVQVKKMVLLR